MDDTGARHKAQNSYCTHIGNDHFAWFATTQRKNRLNFLELLRAGDEGYKINDAALDYMRDRTLPSMLVKQLAGHETRFFASRDAWMAHLETLGFAELKTHPDPVRIASEGGGRIAALGLLEGTIIPDRGPGPLTAPVSSALAITPCAGCMASGWFTSWTHFASTSTGPKSAYGTASGGFTPIPDQAGDRHQGILPRFNACENTSCGGASTASSQQRPALSLSIGLD